ncbi:brick3 [Zea mays]|uniref:Brick3 n=3 Tax=Zea mays TaxID=4577 RepID=A0A1D6IR12_MAIZE|nr:brick3 [Zea mays]
MISSSFFRRRFSCSLLKEEMAHVSFKSKDVDSGMSRWSEYLSVEEPIPSAMATWRNMSADAPQGSSAGSHKHLQMEPVVQLSKVAEGLLAKMYRLNSILDYPDPNTHTFSDAFWKAGVFPNFPKICITMSKKFPEHPNKLQLERVDKFGLDALNENAEGYMHNLEQWILLLLDLLAFREQALRLILDLSSTVITLLPHQNSLILHAFMDLFCSFVRVNLFSDKMPRKMILQVYNILHIMLKGGRDCEFYHRLVQFVDSYDPPIKGLHEDLNFVSPRIGEVRAQDLANVTSYREWVLLGYLVCPDELLRVTSIDVAMVVLKENLILPLFRDEYILLHENYQLYVLPKVLESKRMAKSGRTKQKEADLEYNVAKQVERMLTEVHEQALVSCDAMHRERRILLKQEIGRMMVFSALALSQCEVIWYFQHVGIASSKSTRLKTVDIDATDPTIGFLLDGIGKLCCLVRKYIAAIKGYALSYLLSSAGRIRFLLGTPGMVALDLDATLKGLFQQVLHCLENIPKPQGESVPDITADLADLRKHWLSILMIVTSSRSSINIKHLEKATVSTGKEGLVSEGNAAYNWSRTEILEFESKFFKDHLNFTRVNMFCRCVDELESQLSKHGSLKKLYFYHQHLTTVFRNTMFGPEGRPQHCCAWLGAACSFPECASAIIPEEVNKIGRDSISYVESLIESIMGGLEGLINILDSEGGFGSLEMQLSPEQAALRLNNTRAKGVSSLLTPGYESYPDNSSSIKMLEAAMQRLTSLCSVLNDMEPIGVLNHVFVLREYMRDCIIGNFRRRFHSMIRTENCIQRPSIIESLLRRHLGIIHLAEQHISMDLTEGIREVLLAESYTGPFPNLQMFETPVGTQGGGSAVEMICNWYIENVVKDASRIGVAFDAIQNCFRSSQPIGGGCLAESFTDKREMKSLVRLFGGYGIDKMDKMLREHTSALLNCIDSALRSNRDALEGLAGTVNSGDRIERDVNLKQIIDLETLADLCIQAGQAITFRRLLVEAVGAVLEEKVPLIYSLLKGLALQLPDEVPDKNEIIRLRKVASSVGVGDKHDAEWVHSILADAGAANDNSWILLPYLCAAFMVSNIWNGAVYDVNIGGLSNNLHCLARCVSAVIGGSEYTRVEREQRINSLSNVHTDELQEAELPSRVSAEANIKSCMQIYVKLSAGIVLDSWNDTSRQHIVPKLTFLDQLCELSPYVPRSTLEAHIPYTILRSIYHQLYGGSLLASEPAEQSPRQSPLISLAHASPSARQMQNRPETTPRSHTFDPGYYSSSGSQHDDGYDADRRTGRLLRSLRRSGPLDFGASRKAKKFVEGSSSGSSHGAGSLQRFAVSRSGPLSYR